MSLDKIATHPLQTQAWFDFRTSWGNNIIETKYGLLTVHKIPFLNRKIAMFIRGPKPTREMLSFLVKLAKEHNFIFIKLEPDFLKQDFDFKTFKGFDIQKGKTLFTPTSFWIDLTKSDDELTKSFKSKTRYNINYANRLGVEVVEDNSDKAFDKFIELMRETVQRQGFYAHSETYFRLMWKFLREAGIASLLVAKYKRKIHTAWVVFKWQDKLYYPYGASSFENKNIQANSAMMWGAIQFGKQNKLKTFDLWGRETGKGFTNFKEGFAPSIVEFLGSWDLVSDSGAYKLYRILEIFRWSILRLKSRFVRPRF